MPSVFTSPSSRYVYGGQTEESARAIEWWEKIQLPRADSDKIYVLEKRYTVRPDCARQLASIFYNDPNLEWVLLQYNKILDPVEELVEGVVLRVPTLERVRQALLNNENQSLVSQRNV